MNSIIKEQLKKCTFQLPMYDDNTTSLFIPKQSNEVKKEIESDINKTISKLKNKK